MKTFTVPDFGPNDLLDSDVIGERRVKVSSISTDSYGHESQVSMMGESITAGYFDDISVNFQYGIRTRDVLNGGFTAGTGATGNIKSSAYVECGTGIGEASLTSLAAIRYRAGHDCYCRPSVIFGEPQEGVNQYAGLFNGQDAISVGYQGLVFGIWYIEGWNVNFIPQADWNIDLLDGKGKSRWTLNPQGANIPVISFTWHGFKDITVAFDRGDGVIYVAHVIKNIGTATETHLENPSLPMAVKVERVSGSGPTVRLLTSSWRGGIVAAKEGNTTADSWFNVTILDAGGIVNGRNNIVSIRNKGAYNGKNNHLKVELGVVTFANDLNKTVAVFGTLNPIIAGASSFTDVDTVNSVLEYRTGGTISGGLTGPATVLKTGQDRRTDVLNTGIVIYPNQELAIEVDPAATVNGTFSVSLRFKEYH